MAKSVVVFCAHNDDQILGIGGTLAKYAEEGINIVTIIFSFGELTHPWLKTKVAAEMRIKESKKADKVLGGKVIQYFGLKEGNFLDEKKKPKIKQKIMEIIKKYKPIKIFTHNLDDPHPDHKAVNHVVTEVLDEMKYEGNVYSFDVWNILNLRFRRRNLPELVVDITNTFKKKIDACKCHKSQKLTMISLLWNIYVKALLNGLNNDCKYAEVFLKIR